MTIREKDGRVVERRKNSDDKVLSSPPVSCANAMGIDYVIGGSHDWKRVLRFSSTSVLPASAPRGLALSIRRCSHKNLNPAGRMWRGCGGAYTAAASGGDCCCVRSTPPTNCTMCVILLAWQVHPIYSLILAANRDEYYDRTTLPAGRWKNGNDKDAAPQLIAGRDVDRGGTWLGVTDTGKLAAVTNYRQGPERVFPASRGELTTNFLQKNCGKLDKKSPQAYLQEIPGEHYGGYNLLVGDLKQNDLWWGSNRAIGKEHKIEPGVHGVSNHLLDSPWPKVTQGKIAIEKLLSEKLGEAELTDKIFEVLSNRQRARDDELPDTGIELEWERALSSVFIAVDGYGTRSSSVILVRHDGVIKFIEKSFGPGGFFIGQVEHQISIQVSE